jgi:hypothetical protein
MKVMWMTASVLLLSANAFAAEKICFGNKGDSSSEGTHMTVTFTTKQVVVDDGDYKGTYKRFKGAAGTVNGRDGVTYLDYDMGGEEGCTEVLAAEDLMDKGGEGELKFRCRGEGFSDVKYFCRDEKKK